MALLRLPEALREELKEPLGPVHADAEGLLAAADGPLIAVGDIVTYHLERAGRTPDVSVIDDRTERSPVDEEVRRSIGDADVTVENPPATLTADLLEAIRDAVDAAGPIRIRVEGEEDLAALPAILAAPEGANVVYGQPGEGMVRVRVTPASRASARDLLERMDGDAGCAIDLLTSR